jgi:hypothetical protein
MRAVLANTSRAPPLSLPRRDGTLAYAVGPNWRPWTVPCTPAARMARAGGASASRGSRTSCRGWHSATRGRAGARQSLRVKVHEEDVTRLFVEQVEDGEVHGWPSGGGKGADGGILSPTLPADRANYQLASLNEPERRPLRCMT